SYFRSLTRLRSFPTRRSTDLEVEPASATAAMPVVESQPEATAPASEPDTESQPEAAAPAPEPVTESQPEAATPVGLQAQVLERRDRKSTRLNSSHVKISYAVF